MLRDKGLEKGANVLVFKHVRELGELGQDELHFIHGTVVDKQIAQNLAPSVVYHEFFYTVVGEDGKRYFGTYGTGSVGGSFFRTPEDHIQYLQGRAASNNIEIKRRQQENTIIYDMIAELSVQAMATPQATTTAPVTTK